MVRALVLVFLVAVAGNADAQGPNPAGAKLFEEGRALAKDGRYAEACEKFARSLELDPAIGTQLNYADCHEKLGQYPEAWRLFDGAADAEKITNPQRAKFARERADSLLPKVGVVVLKLATPDAPMLAVSIGGRTVKPAPVIKEIVKPGEVAIAVTAQNAPPFQQTQTVAAGKSVTIEVPALGEPTDGGTTTTIGGTGAGDPVMTAPGPIGDEGSTRRQRSRVYLAAGLAGAGLISFGASVFVARSAKSDWNAQLAPNGDCTIAADGEPICTTMASFDAMNDAVFKAHIGTVLGVGGIALVGVGAVLFLTAPKELAVSPTVTARSAGFTVVGRF